MQLRRRRASSAVDGRGRPGMKRLRLSCCGCHVQRWHMRCRHQLQAVVIASSSVVVHGQRPGCNTWNPCFFDCHGPPCGLTPFPDFARRFIVSIVRDGVTLTQVRGFQSEPGQCHRLAPP